MNKDEIIEIMLKSFEDDNMSFCFQAGMDEDEATQKMIESRPTMKYFFSNIHDILLEKNIIKSE
jgi:hypothetical protein